VANVLTAAVPRILAGGLLALRQNAIMPQLVNRKYELLAGQKGTSVDVPIPSAIAAADVTPGATPPATADVQPTSVSVTLNNWKEAAFYLTDKDLVEVMNGAMPMMASEAIKSLINAVDASIFATYPGVYGFTGTPGTAPFGSNTVDATEVRRILTNQLAPLTDRRLVMNPDAEANALNLRAFQDASWTGDTQAIIQGRLNERLGFGFWMDQNVVTHTAGTVTGLLVNNGAGYAAGTKTIATDTGSGTLVAGDIITFAGHNQTYAVVSSVGGGTITSVTFEPGLAVAVTDNVAITRKASHVVNLAFHRDAIAFASRPFEDNNAAQLGSIIQSAVDEISGLALRLEVTREHKRTRFSYDMLWGAQLVRPALAARLAG